MSGIDEVKTLWILEYKEWISEDYIHSYRGIMARDKEEAEKIGRMVVEYYDVNYNESDDEESPDYIFVRILSSIDSSSFIHSDEELLRMEEHLVEYREEMGY